MDKVNELSRIRRTLPIIISVQFFIENTTFKLITCIFAIKTERSSHHYKQHTITIIPIKKNKKLKLSMLKI